MEHSKHADEYCTYSEVLDGRNDRFCSVIKEVTTDSSVDSYSCEPSDTSQSLESKEKQKEVINPGFQGFRPPGIPSCIEEQNEECYSSSDGTEEAGFQNEKEHSFTL